MEKHGIDYSWGRPGAPAILAEPNGFSDFVVRYLNYPGANGKEIGPAELEELVAHGIKVCFVFERDAMRAAEGYEAGFEDADLAWAAIRNLGIEVLQTVYFAIDFDTNESHWPAIEAYFRALNERFERGTVGGYGEKTILEHLLALGLISYAWQCSAWSGDAVLEGRNMFQWYLGALYLNGVPIDYNTAYTEDYGQYPREEALDLELRRMVLAGGEQTRAGKSVAERDEYAAWKLTDLEESGAESLASQVGSLAAGVKELAQAVKDLVVDGAEPDLDALLERLGSLESKLTAASAALGGTP